MFWNAQIASECRGGGVRRIVVFVRPRLSSRTGWTPLVPWDLSERSGRQIDALRVVPVQ